MRAAARRLRPPGAVNLEILDLKPGAGAPVASGQKAVVQYTGWLYEASASDNKGKQFDSSANAGPPFRFVVGTGQVIKGWDQGVARHEGRREAPPDHSCRSCATATAAPAASFRPEPP